MTASIQHLFNYEGIDKVIDSVDVWMKVDGISDLSEFVDAVNSATSSLDNIIAKARAGDADALEALNALSLDSGGGPVTNVRLSSTRLIVRYAAAQQEIMNAVGLQAILMVAGEYIGLAAHHSPKLIGRALTIAGWGVQYDMPNINRTGGESTLKSILSRE